MNKLDMEFSLKGFSYQEETPFQPILSKSKIIPIKSLSLLKMEEQQNALLEQLQNQNK